MRRSITVAVILTFLSAAPAFAYDHGDFQIWSTYGEEVKVHKGVKVVMEQEYRFGENATELYYQHYDWGAVFSFDKMFDLGFFYRQIFARYKKKWREEDMPNVNATIKLDLWKFKFEDRNRLEYRHYRYQNDSVRYRNKFSLKYPMEFKKIKMTIAPYLSDEIFVVSTGAGYNENRFCSGTEFQLTKYAKADIYYMLRELRVKGSKWTWENTLGMKAKIAF